MTDLQPTDDGVLNRIALDGTAIRIDDERYRLYARTGLGTQSSSRSIDAQIAPRSQPVSLFREAQYY
jgi:hypothetical protein